MNKILCCLLIRCLEILGASATVVCFAHMANCVCPAAAHLQDGSGFGAGCFMAGLCTRDCLGGSLCQRGSTDAEAEPSTNVDGHCKLR